MCLTRKKKKKKKRKEKKKLETEGKNCQTWIKIEK